VTTTLGLSLLSKSEAIVMAPETLLRIYWSVFRETLKDSETSRSHLLKVRGSNCPPGISHSHEKGCLGLSWRVAGTQLFCGFRSKQTIEYGLRATQIQAFCWQGKSTTWLRMAGSFHSRRDRTNCRSRRALCRQGKSTTWPHMAGSSHNRGDRTQLQISHTINNRNWYGYSPVS
jgi:hypothetical protein